MIKTTKVKAMQYTRRQILKLGLGSTLSTCFLIANRTSLFAALPAQRPNSLFKGVQIGVIAPYSFGNLNNAEDLLNAMVEIGISATELQNGPVDNFAGAPGGGGGRGGAAAVPNATADQTAAITALNDAVTAQTMAVTSARVALAQASFADAPSIPARMADVSTAELALAKARAAAVAKMQDGPARLNADQIGTLVAQATGGARGGGARGGAAPGGAGGNDATTQWRATVSMDRFKALRKLYNDAGVRIYAYKMGLGLNAPDSDYKFAFDVVEALGASHLTLEMPNAETTKRIGEYAASRKLWVGYHAHTQAHLAFWDTAFSQSAYNGANIDFGHYVGGTSESPIPFVEKYHDRITSAHFKDKMKGTNGGQNMPWGQGETPIKEILLLMAEKKYKFPATIELEYGVPQGSTRNAEIAKCLQFCKNALA